MITIHTKYIPPSATRGSRIKASHVNGPSVIVPYRHNGLDCHIRAAKALIAKLCPEEYPYGMQKARWISADMKDGYIHVMADDHSWNYYDKQGAKE